MKQNQNKITKSNNCLFGWLFILPIIVGIVLFTLVPMISSLFYSFFDYDVMTPAKNFGFQNYIKIFTTEWNVVKKSLSITAIFAVVSVPLGLVISFLLAIYVNKGLKGIGIFRTLYYIPIMVPAVVMGLIWTDLFDYDYGIINSFLIKIGQQPNTFFSGDDTALPTFILTAFFGIGSNMILWLAQLANIPKEFYEAANIEGSSKTRILIYITIPLSTPMIFYQLVLGMINAIQVFSAAFLLNNTSGALNFFVVYIYNQAFTRMNMGYASALSWLLFAIIALLTLTIFKSSRWVYYGEDA